MAHSKLIFRLDLRSLLNFYFFRLVVQHVLDISFYSFGNASAKNDFLEKQIVLSVQFYKISRCLLIQCVVNDLTQF